MNLLAFPVLIAFLPAALNYFQGRSERPREGALSDTTFALLFSFFVYQMVNGKLDVYTY